MCSVELETAAAEVEDAAVRGAAADRGGKRVEPSPAVLLDLEKPRLAKDTKVLGGVVLRDADALRDLPDVERFLNQHPDNPHPGALAERLQRDDTIIASIQASWRRGRQTVKGEGLTCPARWHGETRSPSHKPPREARSPAGRRCDP